MIKVRSIYCVDGWVNGELGELELLAAYTKRLERQIVSKDREYIETQAMPDYDPEQPWEIHNNIIEVRDGLSSQNWSFDIVFDGYFPNLQLYSTLVLFCSHFEKSIANLGAYYSKERGLKSFSEIFSEDSRREKKNKKIPKGSYLEKYFWYLSKFCCLQLDCDRASWLEILSVNGVRNCIVHNGGFIFLGKKGEKISAYIKSGQYISVSESNTIVLEISFLYRYVEVLKDFVGHIGEKINLTKNIT